MSTAVEDFAGEVNQSLHIGAIWRLDPEKIRRLGEAAPNDLYYVIYALEVREVMDNTATHGYVGRQIQIVHLKSLFSDKNAYTCTLSEQALTFAAMKDGAYEEFKNKKAKEVQLREDTRNRILNFQDYKERHLCL